LGRVLVRGVGRPGGRGPVRGKKEFIAILLLLRTK